MTTRFYKFIIYLFPEDDFIPGERGEGEVEREGKVLDDFYADIIKIEKLILIQKHYI